MSYFIRSEDGSSLIIGFDWVETESHIDASMVTSHPVEDAFPVTDHMRPEPALLSLVLGVTNTPIGLMPGSGQGGPIPIDIPTPKFAPPFDFTPGAAFREAGGAISSLFGSTEETKTVEVFGFATPVDRVRDVEQALLTLKLNLSIVSVSTRSRDYRSMVIARHEMQRTGPGSALFSIDLQQVRLVQTATVAAPVPAEPRGAPMANKGQQALQTPKNAKEAANMRSLALKLAESAAGAF